MKILLRKKVDFEIEAGFTHYLKHAGGKTAGAFLDAVDHGLSRIELFPEAGSPRYKHLFPEIDVRF